jgi:hypothetical protein
MDEKGTGLDIGGDRPAVDLHRYFHGGNKLVV